MHKGSLWLLSLLIVCYGCGKRADNSNTHESQKPNIILIMSDDMGYSDLGCYGGEIHTPHLDKLAQNGLRFTQFYNTARCCPTRASLMTGLYPHQTGIGHMTNPPLSEYHDYHIPGYRGVLSTQTVTLAELLKSAGYHTLMSGKWHLGMEEERMWPLQRGFEQFYGILAGATNYFAPTHPRGITEQNNTIPITDPNYYTTDAFTDKAISFIDKASGEGEAPFFLYLAYNAPHWPIQAPKEDIDKYRKRYKEGWGKLRQERYERMVAMGLIEEDWSMSPQDAQDWDELPAEKQEEMALRMAIYAAQVDRMDQNIGKLVNHLEAQGELDNTLIIFLDDNGACAEGGPLGGGPAAQLETLKGYFLTYGQAWANASNTPFREYKHWIHEGGISSPFIVHWPEGIAADRRGTLVDQYGHLPDIMATLMELTGAKYPTQKSGKRLPQPVGESLLPLIQGVAETKREQPIFWEHEGNKAIRDGDYKLVMKWNDEGPQQWELYNMKNDRTELHDLASSMPEKVDEMAGLWEQWAENHQVEPWDKVKAIMERDR
ncbi:arylsulfatase A family protein [Echinicola vietnamensis DSM 17526]|uniref:Arylsulfatase A family protein n=2 Tax=Echinicola TaxID=390846 RepID=L0G388_ECHVK|nr:arylsulfatase A family protein [Echinicola vietnamensis DSM 17526]